MEITKIENSKRDWINEKFIKEIDPVYFSTAIKDILNYLSLFYGLVSLNDLEIEFITEFLINFVKEYPAFKISDLYKSLNYKFKPELNKITAFYLESIFKNYINSEERKNILMNYKNTLDNTKQIEAPKFTPGQLLENCKMHFDKTGLIFLNDGAVFKNNFELLETKIGISKMQEIADITKINFIKQINKKIKSVLTNSEREVWTDIKKQIEKNGILLKIEIRKEILKYYFTNY